MRSCGLSSGTGTRLSQIYCCAWGPFRNVIRAINRILLSLCRNRRTNLLITFRIFIKAKGLSRHRIPIRIRLLKWNIEIITSIRPRHRNQQALNALAIRILVAASIGILIERPITILTLIVSLQNLLCKTFGRFVLVSGSRCVKAGEASTYRRTLFCQDFSNLIIAAAQLPGLIQPERSLGPSVARFIVGPLVIITWQKGRRRSARSDCAFELPGLVFNGGAHMCAVIKAKAVNIAQWTYFHLKDMDVWMP